MSRDEAILKLLECVYLDSKLNSTTFAEALEYVNYANLNILNAIGDLNAKLVVQDVLIDRKANTIEFVF